MTKSAGFFEADQTQEVMRDFLRRLKATTLPAEQNVVRQHLTNILTSMLKAAKDWSDCCSVNIGWIGDQFRNRLAGNNEEMSDKELHITFALAFRFLLELDLSMAHNLNAELSQAKEFAMNHGQDFPGEAATQIAYAIRSMPIAITKTLVNHEAIASLREYNLNTASAKQRETEWKETLDAREQRVDALQKRLDEQTDAFNFVGLHQGFAALTTQKRSELRITRFWMIFFGAAILIPAATELLAVLRHLENLDSIKNALLLSIAPAVSITAILIYFFRIFLLNNRAIESQLLQLELRKTLCAFIQNYAEYSVTIKEKDKEALSKFENIVFSGLVSDNEKLPSTFDGLEQIAGLIKTVKQ